MDGGTPSLKRHLSVDSRLRGNDEQEVDVFTRRSPGNARYSFSRRPITMCVASSVAVDSVTR